MGCICQYLYGGFGFIEVERSGSPHRFPAPSGDIRVIEREHYPAGDGGRRITAAERAAIHLLPLSSSTTPADLDALLDRFDGIMAGTLELSQAEKDQLTGAANDLSAVAEELQNRGWVTTYDAFYRGTQALVDDQAAAANPSGQREVALYYKITNLSNGFIQRGRLNLAGQLDQISLAPNSFCAIKYSIRKA